MGKRRLIPKLQIKTRKIGSLWRPVVVTTNQFENPIDIGDPVSQAKIFEAQAADELIFLDLEADPGSREQMLATLQAVSAQIFMPFTVGGGVGSLADFRTLLLNGADKVSVCTAAVDNAALLTEAAQAFGSQCVVLSIDYRREPDGQYRVWTNGGKTRTDWDPVAWAIEGARRGAGEILLTSIDRDGQRQGLDTTLTQKIVASVPVPVITSGGCGQADHFVAGFIEGHAEAVAAGTYFCLKDENPMQTRSRVKNAGIPIRIIT